MHVEGASGNPSGFLTDLYRSVDARQPDRTLYSCHTDMLVRGSIRRALVLLLACLAFVVRTASATEPAVQADFDGDGRGDLVTLDRSEPSVLHVWLSSSNATSIVRSTRPIVRVWATDLDGDRRAELIADTPSSIQVWSKKRLGFRSYRPRRILLGDLTPPRRRIDDGPLDSRSAVVWSGPILPAMLAGATAMPPPSSAAGGRPGALPVHVLARPLAPLAPRPPPIAA